MRAFVEGEEDAFDGDVGQRDPFGPLLDALRLELADYRDFLKGQTVCTCRIQPSGGRHSPHLTAPPWVKK